MYDGCVMMRELAQTLPLLPPDLESVVTDAHKDIDGGVNEALAEPNLAKLMKEKMEESVVRVLGSDMHPLPTVTPDGAPLRR